MEILGRNELGTFQELRRGWSGEREMERRAQRGVGKA